MEMILLRDKIVMLCYTHQLKIKQIKIVTTFENKIVTNYGTDNSDAHDETLDF